MTSEVINSHISSLLFSLRKGFVIFLKFFHFKTFWSYFNLFCLKSYPMKILLWRTTDLITTFTYVLMDTFCPCLDTYCVNFFLPFAQAYHRMDPIQCEFCQVQLKNRSYLQIHIRRAHRATFNCRQCDTVLDNQV